jgi:hypothetical protein
MTYCAWIADVSHRRVNAQAARLHGHDATEAIDVQALLRLRVQHIGRRTCVLTRCEIHGCSLSSQQAEDGNTLRYNRLLAVGVNHVYGQQTHTTCSIPPMHTRPPCWYPMAAQHASPGGADLPLNTHARTKAVPQCNTHLLQQHCLALLSSPPVPPWLSHALGLHAAKRTPTPTTAQSSPHMSSCTPKHTCMEGTPCTTRPCVVQPPLAGH